MGESVQYLNYGDIATFVVVLLAFCSALVLIDKAVRVVIAWRKPKESQCTADRPRESCERMFRDDLARIDSLEKSRELERETNTVVLTSLRAILSHEINGNSIDRMKAANEEIDKMLISRQGG